MIWGLIVCFIVCADNATPRCTDDRLVLRLVASEPDLVTPAGMAIDRRGRVFVIESHTHFRPANYQGPAKDRIRLFENIGPDGKAGKISTFFEGTEATMTLGIAASGDLYIATRSEILMIPGADRIDHAKEARSLIRLETKGNYPHNGLSGFAFHEGQMFFGLGENLGAPYRLVGSDGSSCEGGGEGGSIYQCQLDGSKLERIATGFWNPFHLYRYPGAGPLFTVDNDPDARPPCRLLHVVPGGDYGFKFRYGRNGLHPFHAWNGELPGTLPMVTGTGEAPSGVVGYLGDALPSDYFGSLFVTSWGDHRIERYRLIPSGASYRSTMEPIVVGDENFRPVGIAVAPDGAVYFSDWVDKSYDLHGKGRLWKIDAKSAKTSEKRHLPPELSRDSAQIHHQDPPTGRLHLDELGSPDAFVRCRARQALAHRSEVELIDLFRNSEGPPRAEVLIILRDKGLDNDEVIREALRDPDPTVRLVVVQWIGDRRLVRFKDDLEATVGFKGVWTRALFDSTLAAIELLERGWATAEAGASFAVRLLERSDTAPEIARRALRSLPADHPWLTSDRYGKLLSSTDEGFAIEATRSLRESPTADARMMLLQLAGDKNRPDRLRIEAILGLRKADDRELLDALYDDPSPDIREAAKRVVAPKEAAVVDADVTAADVDRVLKLAASDGEVEAGERLFFSPVGPGCYRCHQAEGRGSLAGPDLSTIARGLELKRLVESILDPSKEVAPHYVPWLIVTVEGQTFQGLLSREGLEGEQFYIDSDGRERMLRPTEIEERRPSRESLMPSGLLRELSDSDIVDLFTYLKALK